ncbi:MAG: hypothetical protein ACRD4R_00215 [Candidatus Acidiferrales bacterium]
MSAALVLTCSLLVWAGHPKLPSKKQAEAMLQRAADAANLWAPGTPPYHLSATVHLELGGSKFDGRYDLWWAAPDKYREGFLMPANGGTIVETDLALGNKFYVLRNTPALSIPLWRTRNLIRSVAMRIYSQDTMDIGAVHRSKSGGTDKTCVDAGENEMQLTIGAVTELCFDAAGDLISTSTVPGSEVRTPEQVDAIKAMAWTAEEFQAFATGKRFPHRIGIHQNDLALELTVNTLETSAHFDHDTFEPSARAAVLDWCPNPMIGKNSKEMKYVRNGPHVNTKVPGSYIAYYVYVQPDGNVSKVVPLRSDGKSVDRRMEDWFRKFPFPTRSCGGQRIPWEGIVNPPEIISFF